MYQSFPLPALHFFHRPDCFAPTAAGDFVLWTSPEVVAGQDFSSLVLSVLPTEESCPSLETQVQVRQEGRWSSFFRLAVYGQDGAASFGPQTQHSGFVDTDVLTLYAPAQAYRVRLVGKSAACVCVALTPAKQAPQTFVCPAGKRELPVEPVSQQQLPTPQRMRLCSPCSLTMALNALGAPSDVSDTAQAVYDHYAGIYGNWTFNTAYACRRGLAAAVLRVQSLTQLTEYISPQSLLCASIAYKAGELPGAPMEQTPGHLVLVRGWEDGKILVADPAAPTAQSVLRSYDAQSFSRAWLMRKGGASYLVRKK